MQLDLPKEPEIVADQARPAQVDRTSRVPAAAMLHGGGRRRRQHYANDMPNSSAPQILVLDTQVVMDWMVFGDASMTPLVGALEAGRLDWIGTPAMLDELRHVLGRGVAARYMPDLARIEAGFGRLCRMVEHPVNPSVHLRCRDGDDQKFIDLALGESARWLVSRDRAVLALARRARPQGLEILTPAAWNRLHPAPDGSPAAPPIPAS